LKKVAFIFLLVVLLLQTGGLVVVYKIQQCSVKFQMREAIHNSQSHFESLTLTKEEFQKFKNGDDELSFNGKMYDIKSKTFNGDKVVLLVLNDTKEENIIESIKDFFRPDSKDNKDLPKQLVKLTVSEYTLPQNAYIYNNESLSSFCFSLSQPVYHSLAKEINSPPPQV
jgi:hypothetical protein